jgi:hypothetical protein
MIACLVMYGADRLALWALRTHSYIPNAMVTPSGVLLTFPQHTGRVDGCANIYMNHDMNVHER